MALSLNEWMKQRGQQASQATSTEPLDTTGTDKATGKRPYMSISEWQAQRTPVTGSPQDIPPAPQPAPQEAPEAEPRDSSQAVPGLSDVEQRASDAVSSLEAQGVRLSPYVTGGSYGTGVENIQTQATKVAAQAISQEAKENFNEWYADNGLPLVGSMAAGIATGGAGFIPTLVAGMGGAGLGELVEQGLKKEDVMQWGQKETPWVTVGDLAKRVGYEAAIDGITTTATAGIGGVGKWAFSKAADTLRNSITSKVRAGMEPILERIRAGDEAYSKIPAYYLYDSTMLNTAKAIVENSSVTGSYVKQVNKEAEDTISQYIYGVGVNPKIQGEAAKIVRDTVSKELNAIGKSEEEIEGYIQKYYENRFGFNTASEPITDADPKVISKAVTKSLDSRNRMLGKDLDEAGARYSTLIQRAKAQHMDAIEESLKNNTSDEIVKSPWYLKLDSERKETVEKLLTERARVDSLVSSMKTLEEARVDISGDAAESIIKNHVDSVVDEVLSANNNVGRANLIHSGLLNAKAYGEVAAAGYYEPVAKSMKAIEEQTGGAYIDPKPLNQVVQNRLEMLERIAQDEPHVSRLAGLTDNALSYADARQLTSMLKETKRRLNIDKQKGEAAFLGDAISSLEASIREGLETAGGLLDDASVSLTMPDGSPMKSQNFLAMYDRANELYRQTQEGFGSRWVASIMKHSHSSEGAANQVMATFLSDPVASKEITKYLQQQAVVREVEKTELSSSILAKYGIDPVSTASTNATLKGGALSYIFQPQVVDGSYVLKLNRKALEDNKEALGYLFDTKELHRINNLATILDSVEATKKSGMFAYLQRAKEYHNAVGAVAGLADFVLRRSQGGIEGLSKVLTGAGALNYLGRYMVSDGFTAWLAQTEKVNMKDPVMYGSMKQRLTQGFDDFINAEMSLKAKGVAAGVRVGTHLDPSETPTDSFEDQLKSELDAMGYKEIEEQGEAAVVDEDFQALLEQEAANLGL